MESGQNLLKSGQNHLLSSKTKGPGEKEAPRKHPEISSQKLALFWRRILGQYPAAPCSPGPFVLLLMCFQTYKAYNDTAEKAKTG